jgi:uncharacterized protein (DUF2147 family)
MRSFALAVLLLAALPLSAQNGGLTGNWREPGGSIIRVAPCGIKLCATLAAIPANAPSQFDIHNPDAAQRKRSLCGLVIGKSFRETSSTHAQDGTLYDPKTGKTYSGEMTVKGDSLDLRGYIGISLFGRSETWTRTNSSMSCRTHG